MISPVQLQICRVSFLYPSVLVYRPAGNRCIGWLWALAIGHWRETLAESLELHWLLLLWSSISDWSGKKTKKLTAAAVFDRRKKTSRCCCLIQKKQKKINPTCRIRTSDLRIILQRLQSSALPTELRSVCVVVSSCCLMEFTSNQCHSTLVSQTMLDLIKFIHKHSNIYISIIERLQMYHE